MPVIFVGDFNTCPQAPLYNLMRYGKLQYSDYMADKISGNCNIPLYFHYYTIDMICFLLNRWLTDIISSKLSFSISNLSKFLSISLFHKRLSDSSFVMVTVVVWYNCFSGQKAGGKKAYTIPPGLWCTEELGYHEHGLVERTDAELLICNDIYRSVCGLSLPTSK